SLDNVPRVGVGNIDDVMRELLGQAPISGSLRVRTVISGDLAILGQQVSNTDPNTYQVETLIEELVLEELILDASLIRHGASLGTQSRPLGLPFAHDDDVKCMDALLAGTAPPKVTSVWQALLQLSWAKAQSDVQAASGRDRFHEVINFATAISAVDRARVVATAANASKLGSSALHAEADRVKAMVMAN